MAQMLSRIQQLAGWRRGLAAFLAGSFSVLAHAPFNLWPILFFTLPLLVLLIDSAVAQSRSRSKRLRSGFAIGWAFGFGYFLFGLYWIARAFLVDAGTFAVFMPFAMTLMPAGLALFYGLAVVTAASLWHRGLSRLLLLAVTFALVEWLRGHIFTGFPWNAFGYVFAGEAGLSQLSSLFGPYALSFYAILLFSLPLLTVQQYQHTNSWKGALAPALTSISVLVIASSWGHYRLNSANTGMVEGVRLRLVQPNIKQVDKWKPGNAGPIYQTMLKLSGLATSDAPKGLAEVTHLIWPETALPFFMARSNEALQGIDTLLPDHVQLITGALRHSKKTDDSGAPQNTAYNSLYVFDGKARIQHSFDKKHLVPFGEYLPYKELLEQIGLKKLTAIKSGFGVGKQHRLIKLQTAPAFSPLICYEVVFPHEIIEPGERPGWLINVTNDAWYGVSTGPYQHLQQSRIRAIETGLPMIRAANTGISAVITPYGRILKSKGLARAGTIDSPLPAAAPETIYARHGGLLFLLTLLLALQVALFAARAGADPE